MTAAISFTLDLEDHRASRDEPPRHVGATRRALEFLGERGIRGTFFVVGDIAEEHADLVAAVAADGHEVGVHGHRHVPLTELDPEAFRAGVKETRARLEDVVQRDVVGFRAPMFSLVAGSGWAPDVLADLGFAYSSSTLPVRHPLYGDARLPKRPFRWPSGLVELPCPVARVGAVGLPWLAAVWLRNLPFGVARSALALARPDECLWTYSHPYDFDPGEPFRVLPEAGRIGSTLIWRRRTVMERAFDRLLAGRAAPPLRDRLAEVVEPLPRFAFSEVA